MGGGLAEGGTRRDSDPAGAERRHAAGMVVKIRCVVCRATVVACPTAGSAQKVCGAQCRKKRNRMLARKRRKAHLTDYRQDEVQRKRDQRAREKAARRALTQGLQCAAWQDLERCHAPGSVGNLPEVLAKVDQIVDEALAMSRARLRRQLERMILSAAGQSSVPPARAGP